MPYYRMLFQKPQVNELFKHHKNEEKHSPYNKIPCRAMPQTCEKPYNEGIDNKSELSFFISSQRNVDIFAEPSSKGYMPSAPEIRDRYRAVRIGKILREPKAQHIPHTYRHKRIPKKIKIYLHRVSPRAKPCRCRINSHHAGHHDIIP